MKWATFIVDHCWTSPFKGAGGLIAGVAGIAVVCLAASSAVAKDDQRPPLESLVVEAPDDAGGSAAGSAAGSNPAEEAPPAHAEVEATEAGAVEAEAESFSAQSHLSDPSESTDPRPRRIVELPEDFAAPDRRTVVIPDRPSWVDRKPGLVGDDYCISVSSALSVASEDCRPSLNEQLEEAVKDYVADHLGSPQANYFIQFDLHEIRNELVAQDEQHQEFMDVVEVLSLGPMHQSHAMLRITPEFRERLELRWSEIRQTGRVLKTAGASVGVFVLLVAVFGYFRLDSATKGYYTRRLQLLLVVAILALIGLGVFYFRNTAELIYRFTI